MIFADDIMAFPLELCLGQLEFLYFLLQIVAIGVELAWDFILGGWVFVLEGAECEMGAFVVGGGEFSELGLFGLIHLIR